MATFDYFKFKKPEISELFKKARRIYRSHELDLLATPKKLDYGRLLIIVPKKIGNAPTRNKIKRQLRALFYENKLFDASYDFAVIIKKPGVALSFQELQSKITSQIKPEMDI